MGASVPRLTTAKTVFPSGPNPYSPSSTSRSDWALMARGVPPAAGTRKSVARENEISGVAGATKTTWRPSGEKRGPFSAPGLSVSRRVEREAISSR